MSPSWELGVRVRVFGSSAYALQLDPRRHLRPGINAADVGDEARLGNIMKLTGNFYIAAAIELIAEGMNMGERAGLSRDTLLEFYSYMLPGVYCTPCSFPHH